jgi:hypothetical protein
MTIIRDQNGTRWVEIPLRKRRKSPRALRFAEIKVGDQLMFKWPDHLNAGVVVWYYLVTDLWFDPVAGQEDETAGRMVGIQHIDWRSGEADGRKQPHTLRGLASQGFHYADIDFMAQLKAANQGMAEGKVIRIGQGHLIRRRPKVPDARF